jgi:Mn-dependent DtxR family transcriptional regulator
MVDGGHLAKLTPRELKVWIALYRHASADGTMRVSGSTLGRLAGIEREHASRTTKRLERVGYIECVTRGRTLGQKGKRTANVFRILAPPPNSANVGTNQGYE